MLGLVWWWHHRPFGWAGWRQGCHHLRRGRFLVLLLSKSVAESVGRRCSLDAIRVSLRGLQRLALWKQFQAQAVEVDPAEDVRGDTSVNRSELDICHTRRVPGFV